MGGRLAQHLFQEGHEVRITTRHLPSSCPEWSKKWDICQVSSSDESSWARALQDIDFVYHLASPDAKAAALDPCSTLKANIEMIWTLLEAVNKLKHNIPVVNISTFHVYGSRARGVIKESICPQPVHPYAIGHFYSEIIAQRFYELKKNQILNIRLSNGFGAPVALDSANWSLIFNDLCMQAATSSQLRLNSSGRQKRNFITLEDMSRALLFVATHIENWPDDRTLHIGGKNHWSMKEVAEKVAERSEKILSVKPKIITPQNNSEKENQFVIFDVSRLEKMGFFWRDRFDFEIDNTLKLCMK